MQAISLFHHENDSCGPFLQLTFCFNFIETRVGWNNGQKFESSIFNIVVVVDAIIHILQPAFIYLILVLHSNCTYTSQPSPSSLAETYLIIMFKLFWKRSSWEKMGEFNFTKKQKVTKPWNKYGKSTFAAAIFFLLISWESCISNPSITTKFLLPSSAPF